MLWVVRRGIYIVILSTQTASSYSSGYRLCILISYLCLMVITFLQVSNNSELLRNVLSLGHRDTWDHDRDRPLPRQISRYHYNAEAHSS